MYTRPASFEKQFHTTCKLWFVFAYMICKLWKRLIYVVCQQKNNLHDLQALKKIYLCMSTNMLFSTRLARFEHKLLVQDLQALNVLSTRPASFEREPFIHLFKTIFIHGLQDLEKSCFVITSKQNLHDLQDLKLCFLHDLQALNCFLYTTCKLWTRAMSVSLPKEYTRPASVEKELCIYLFKNVFLHDLQALQNKLVLHDLQALTFFSTRPASF